MNFRYLSLFMVLSICMPVSGAHFSRRFRQFVRQYPGPLLGTGVGVASYFNLSFMQKKMVATALVDEKDQEELGIVNPEIKKFIKDECERHDWKPDFVAYTPDNDFKGNILTVSDGTKTGLIVGSGWGLGAKESESSFSIKTCKFVIGHEATHARYDDAVDKVKILSLESVVQGIAWHVLRASGRGKIFSIVTSVFAGGLSHKVLLCAPFNKWQEFRADRESAERVPENIDGGIESLEVNAQNEAARSRLIRDVMSGKGTEFQLALFKNVFQVHLNGMLTHPSAVKRIGRLEAIKNRNATGNKDC